MASYSLPLFPLDVVICPGGLIPLKIFEARYLDMVRSCLRNHTMFAIVAVLPEDETDPEGNFPFANVGTAVEIVDTDVTTVGLMMIRCVGQYRVKVNSSKQQIDGLVVGDVVDIPNDLPMTVPEDLRLSSRVLKQLLDSWNEQHKSAKHKLVIEPYCFEDASWVANRWVELLDLPLLEKQRLMQLDSSILRLELIQDILEMGYHKIV